MGQLIVDDSVLTHCMDGKKTVFKMTTVLVNNTKRVVLVKVKSYK